MHSTLRTVVLFGTLILLFMFIGYVIGYFFMADPLYGMFFFLGLAALMNLIAYFFSSSIVLRSYRAKIVTQNEAPRLHKVVSSICLKSDLPMPRMAIVPSQTPNAFATGRNKKNAVVAVTEGILTLLDDDELEGVLAHEMAHVRNRDILVMSAAATIAGAIGFAASSARWSLFLGNSRNNGNALILLLVAITVPIAALLVQLAISRNREYEADYEGATMIQRPLSLARALQKLEQANRNNPMRRGNPASASLFIVNPFRGAGVISLFMTHPPIESRVRRLRALAEQTGQLR
ncbi:MAG TPA: zinc metalloprotease HtpX [Thermoplasmata archaeon]